MKNFCFKDCQVFQISGCLLIFAKHFSNSCCCMTKGACKIIKRFPYSNLCIVVILFCSSITIERYFFVYLSQGCWTMIIFRSFTFKHKSLHICLYTPEIQSKFYRKSKPSNYSAYQKCRSRGTSKWFQYLLIWIQNLTILYKTSIIKNP